MTFFERQKSYFSGLFIGNGVCIVDKTEAADLYAFGTYGKGILSRSRPSFFLKDSNTRTQRGSSTGMFHVKEARKSAVVDQQISVPTSQSSTSTPTTSIPSSSSIPAPSSVTPSNSTTSSCTASPSTFPSSESDEATLPNHSMGDKNASQPSQGEVEYLQLSLQEAFYLAYGLGCLRILLPNSIEASLLECWNMFNSVDARFCELYCAYHYYRACGWVPKSGTKYGVDFVLYCGGGPASFHAQYAVIVIKHTTQDEDTNRIPLSWGQLNHATRLNEHVAKGLVLCHVEAPTNEDEQDLSNSSSCSTSHLLLPQHRITEVLVQRFAHQ